MGYSKDLRERVLGYIAEGHTQKETSEGFKVGTTTIKAWKKLFSETGDLEKKSWNVSPENTNLKNYVRTF